jgi:uncharacterized membrane protein
LSEAVAASVEHVVALHRDHHEQASRLQRTFDAATHRLAHPSTLAMVTLALALAILGVSVLGHIGIESAVFAWMEFGATVAALLIALLILVTQRREDLLAERRARLMLELEILADRKTAKIIQLLEDLRRDHPDVADRDDPESQAMSEPIDPAKVASAIDEQVDA